MTFIAIVCLEEVFTCESCNHGTFSQNLTVQAQSSSSPHNVNKVRHQHCAMLMPNFIYNLKCTVVHIPIIANIDLGGGGSVCSTVNIALVGGGEKVQRLE